jgi:hypothetical protein
VVVVHVRASIQQTQADRAQSRLGLDHPGHLGLVKAIAPLQVIVPAPAVNAVATLPDANVLTGATVRATILRLPPIPNERLEWQYLLTIETAKITGRKALLLSTTRTRDCSVGLSPRLVTRRVQCGPTLLAVEVKAVGH